MVRPVRDAKVQVLGDRAPSVRPVCESERPEPLRRLDSAQSALFPVLVREQRVELLSRLVLRGHSVALAIHMARTALATTSPSTAAVSSSSATDPFAIASSALANYYSTASLARGDSSDSASVASSTRSIVKATFVATATHRI